MSWLTGHDQDMYVSNTIHHQNNCCWNHLLTLCYVHLWAAFYISKGVFKPPWASHLCWRRDRGGGQLKGESVFKVQHSLERRHRHMYNTAAYRTVSRNTVHSRVTHVCHMSRVTSHVTHYVSIWHVSHGICHTHDMCHTLGLLTHCSYLQHRWLRTTSLTDNNIAGWEHSLLTVITILTDNTAQLQQLFTEAMRF